MGSISTKSQSLDDNPLDAEKVSPEQKVCDYYSTYSKYIKKHSNKIYSWPLYHTKTRKKEIKTVSFSPNGSFIGYCAETKVSIEEAHTTIKKVVLKYKHLDLVKTLGFSLNGRLIASGSEDKCIKIWNIEEKRQETSELTHSSWVNSLSFSPDSNYLAAGCEDGTLKVWDLTEKKEKYMLYAHSSWISCVSYSPNGKFIATGSGDMRIKIWESLEIKEQLYDLVGHSSWINCLAYSLDGKLLASGSDGKYIRVWNLEEGIKELIIFRVNSSVNSLCFSPNGNFIATACEDKNIIILNVREMKEEFILSGHTSSVNFLSYSFDGMYLATCSNDKSIIIWNMHQTRDELKLNHHSYKICSVSFSNDGNYIAASSGLPSIKVWNLQTKFENFNLYGHSAKVNCLIFSNKSKHLISGSEDTSIKVWDMETQKEILSLYGHTSPVKCLCFSLDEKLLVTGSLDSSLKVWNIPEQKEEYSLNGHLSAVTCMTFSSNDLFLTTGSGDQTIKKWNFMKKVEDFTFFLPSSVNCLAYLNGSILLAVGTMENFIHILNTQTKIVEFKLVTHFSSINCLLYVPENNWLISGSQDRYIKVWNMDDRVEKFTLYGHSLPVNCIALSPDRDKIATGSDDTSVKVWTLKNISQSFTLFENDCWAYNFPYSSNGKYLILECGNSYFRLMDLQQQIEIQMFKEKSRKINHFCFSPNEKLFAEICLKSIFIWDLEFKEKVANLYCPGTITTNFCFSADSKYLAAGFKYKSIIIWNVQKGVQISCFNNLPTISSLSFSPDSRFLVLACMNSIIYFCSLQHLKSEFNIILNTKDNIKSINFSKDWKFFRIFTANHCYQYNFIHKILFILDNILAECIKQEKSLKKLYNHALVALYCSGLDQDFRKSKEILQNKYNDILSDSIVNFSLRNTVKILKLLIKFTKIDIFPEFLNQKAVKILHQQFLKKQRISTEFNENYQELIIKYYQEMVKKSEDQKIIVSYIDQLKKIQAFKSKQTSYLDYFRPFEMNKKILLEEIYDWKILDTIIEKFYVISFFEANYFLNEVLIKQYSFQNDILKVYQNSIQIELEKEAKCFELLGKDANSSNCFCEYYGSINIQREFYLVIKNHGITLKSFIRYFKEEGLRLPSFNIAVIVRCLLTSFSLMEYKNILHRNIEPSSFLIDDNFNIVIINYIYSVIKADTWTYEPQMEFLPERSDYYKAPEEEDTNLAYDLEKCDVYSLGLVILELVTLENIKCIRENTSFFVNQTSNSELFWIEKLLKNMLNIKPENRKSFKDLIIYIEYDISETMSAYVIA